MLRKTEVMMPAPQRRFVVGMLLLLTVPISSYSRGSSGQMGSLAISPNGSSIAVDFGTDGGSFIYVIPIDTGIARRLTKTKDGTELSPSFSADGKRIAFAYRPGGQTRSSIVVVSVGGSDLREWSPSGGDDFSPVFSPDGKTIVFGQSQYFGSYSPIAQPHSHAWDFYASDPDGGSVRQITNESFYTASAPSISSDSKNMVVVTEGSDTPQHIAVYSLDHLGKPILMLQPHVPRAADPKSPILDDPNYMPDGRSVLFMAASEGGRTFDYDVYRVDLKTGSIDRLTRGNGYATGLRVSANGKTAVFLKWRVNWSGTPTNPQLCLLDVASHRITRLTITGLN
jgi:Tol biopolymer transport system component